jgi:hypothetical protein
LKTKYQESLLDNKRLQDRIDSLEFYSKNSFNSSAFHNLTPTSHLVANATRARTPAPLPPRSSTSRPSTASSTNSSSSYTNGNTNSNSSNGGGSQSYYDPLYRPSSSRQSSVDRTFYNDPVINTTNSSYFNEFVNVIRSRASSPTPSSSSRLSTLPPPTPNSIDPYRFRHEPSAELSYSRLRNMREGSQDRFSYLPPASPSSSSNRPSNSYTSNNSNGFGLSNNKLRRSSIVETPTTNKYYHY